MNLFLKLPRLRRRKEELDEEIQSHLRMAAEDRVERGEAPSEARSGALREFGNVPLIEDTTRAIWGWAWLEHFGQNVRYALRQLRKTPGFTITALLVLTLGVGANTAIFSLMYTLLLKDLPVAQPQQLVIVSDDESGAFLDALTQRNAKDNGPFQAVFGWDAGNYHGGLEWKDHGSSIDLPFALMSGSGFQALGLNAALGRTLTPADDAADGGQGGWKCVLNDAFWKQHFQGKPNILGRVMMLNDRPVTVVGVLRPGFISLTPGGRAAVYLPLDFIDAFYPPEHTRRITYDSFRHYGGAAWLDVYARLKPNVSLQQAQSYLHAIHGPLENEIFPDRKDYAARMPIHDIQSAEHGHSWLDRTYRLPLQLLQALAGLTLALCCISLAGLFSARATVQRQEFVLRSVLGASRMRLARQVLLQVLPIVVVGVGVSLALSGKVAQLLIAGMLADNRVPLQFDLSPNLAVFLMTSAAALATSLLACLAPLRVVGTLDPASELKEGNFAGLGRRARWRLGWWMPVQVAVATVLTMAAVWFGTTLVRLLILDPGIHPKGLVTFSLDWKKPLSQGMGTPDSSHAKSGEAAKTSASETVLLSRYERFFERLQGMPGIVSASSNLYTFMQNGMGRTKLFHSLGEIEPAVSKVDIDYVGAQFFATVGTRLVAGRDFDENDTPGKPKVCVLNALAANQLFPGAAAVGSEASYSDFFQMKKVACQVVGIVEDARVMNIHQTPRPMIYLSLAQGPVQDFFNAIVRTGDLSMARASIEQALWEVAPGSHIAEVTPLSQSIRDSMGRDRMMAVLAMSFSALALLITGVGLYGLLAYQVSRRRSEIGLRMAVGANRSAIVKLFVRQAAVALAWGSGAGLGCAWMLGKYAESLLYGVHAHTWWTYGACSIILAGMALLASWLPARRAANVDPMQALRSE